MNSLLTVPVSIPEIHADASAISKRDGLSLQAGFIKEIQNKDQLDAAITIGRDIRQYLKEIELCRKSAKDPAIRIGKRIDEIAEEIAGPLEAQLTRIESCCAVFTKTEQERVQREAAEREAMLQKAAQEANAVQAQLKEATGFTDEAGLNQALSLEEQAKQKEAEFRQLACQKPAEVEKKKGTAVGKKYTYEVKDIKAIYAHSPHLVKLEANMAAIRATVFPGMEIPGLEIKEDTSFTIRA